MVSNKMVKTHQSVCLFFKLIFYVGYLWDSDGITQFCDLVFLLGDISSPKKRTMVLEYALTYICPFPKSPSFVGFNIPAPCFAFLGYEKEYISIFMDNHHAINGKISYFYGHFQ